MSGLVVKHLNSLAELRRCAPAWDELWQRSEITLPTARADLIALWCECFAAEQPFRATVVENGGQLVAALPLVLRRRMGVSIGSLPGNHWSSAGDLLLDPQADTTGVCEALLGDLRQGPLGWLWFGDLPGGTNRWQAFLRAIQQQRLAYASRPRFTVNLVRIGPDWTGYFDTRSRNHRRHVRRAQARAERQGPTELDCHDHLPPEQVEPLLRKCFEIEAGGWKGNAHSAVLRQPAIWDFYLRQAGALAAWDQLNLTLLRHRARPIAFEYGWLVKGVYCSPKVGYDEAFAQLSPGQLLRYFLIEQFHHREDVQWVDFFGPASDATSKWATHDYPVERTIVSLGGTLSRAVVAAYRHGWPLARRLRGGGPPVQRRATPASEDQLEPAIVR